MMMMLIIITTLQLNEENFNDDYYHAVNYNDPATQNGRDVGNDHN